MAGLSTLTRKGEAELLGGRMFTPVKKSILIVKECTNSAYMPLFHDQEKAYCTSTAFDPCPSRMALLNDELYFIF